MELDLLVIGSGPGRPARRHPGRQARPPRRRRASAATASAACRSTPARSRPRRCARRCSSSIAQRPLDVLDPTIVDQADQQALQALMDRAARVVGPRPRSCASSSAATDVGLLGGDAVVRGRAHGPRRRRATTPMPRRADRDRRAARGRRARTRSPSTTGRSSTPTGCSASSGGVPRDDDRRRRRRDRRRVRVDVRPRSATKVTVVDQRDRVLAVPRRRDRRGVPVPAAPPQRHLPPARGGHERSRRARAASARLTLALGQGRSPPRPCSTPPAARATPTDLGLEAAGLEADKRGRIDGRRAATAPPVPHIFARRRRAPAVRARRDRRWSRAGSPRCTPSASPSTTLPAADPDRRLRDPRARRWSAAPRSS